MNRPEQIMQEAKIGDRVQPSAVELSLLADQFTDACAHLDNGCMANSPAMIRSAHLSIEDITRRIVFLNTGIAHAIERDRR